MLRQCEEELGLSNSVTNLHINTLRKSFHPKLKGKQSEKVICESTDEKENEKNISVLVKENSNEISELKNETVRKAMASAVNYTRFAHRTRRQTKCNESPFE